MEHGGSSEMDSRVASPSPSPSAFSIDDILPWLERAYPARMTTFGHRGTPAAPAALLVMRYQSGVWEYFDEHGAVTRVEVEHADDSYGGGRFGAIPASEAAIARLPAATACELSGKDCAVCLGSFEEGEELRKMTCPSSHGFHEGCIFRWLRVSRLCPLCRFALPAEHEEEEEDDEEADESDEETEEETVIEGDDAAEC